MKSEGFRHIDTSGDVRFQLWAGSLEGLFRMAVHGFIELVTDATAVRPENSVPMLLTAPDREELLVAWLNELIFLLDTRNFLPREADIIRVSDTSLEANVRGETFDASRHERRLLAKAATYHGLFVKDSGTGLTAEITLDL